MNQQISKSANQQISMAANTLPHYVVVVEPTFVPNVGGHLEAITTALEHFEIPARVTQIVEKSVPAAGYAGGPAYENRQIIEQVKAALRPLVQTGEKLIWRAPFRWHDDDGRRSNHFECMDLQELSDSFGFEIVHDFQHVAVIKEKEPRPT